MWTHNTDPMLRLFQPAAGWPILGEQSGADMVTELKAGCYLLGDPFLLDHQVHFVATYRKRLYCSTCSDRRTCSHVTTVRELLGAAKA